MGAVPSSVARAAARVQSEARRSGFGEDSGDVVVLARGAMSIGPEAAARVGAALLRAALEDDPAALAAAGVGDDVTAIGQTILGLGPVAA